MGNLKKIRLAMRTDRDLRRMLVRGSHNEILLDIDGDGQADIGLIDVDGNGDVDRFALDATGDGWFDLFIDDTDRNGVPDHIFVVKYGGDEELDQVTELAAGPELEQEIIAIAQDIALLLEAKEFYGDQLCRDLNRLDRSVSKVSRVLRAGMR